ncbi:MAG: alpha/beta fold hydrolase [Rhodococcus sp. (in: high G+C Gram-positive bacteria)]
MHACHREGEQWSASARRSSDPPNLDGAYRTEYEVDAADIVELLGDDAHLVGHSYGAVAAMLVVGDWAGAPDEYKRLAVDPLTITARVVADRIGGELLEVPGFYPHVQQPDTVNEALEELWSRADAR